MNDTPDGEQQGAGLRHYIDVVLRRWPIVVGIFALAVLVAAILTFTSDSIYRAETKMVIGQGGTLIQPGVVGAIQPYTATMQDLVKSNIVARRVIRNLGLDETPEQLLHEVHT